MTPAGRLTASFRRDAYTVGWQISRTDYAGRDPREDHVPEAHERAMEVILAEGDDVVVRGCHRQSHRGRHPEGGKQDHHLSCVAKGLVFKRRLFE